MLFLLIFVRKIIKLFTQAASPWLISLGFGIGSLLGFAPNSPALGVLVYLILLIVNVNLSAGIFGHGLLALLRPYTTTVAHSVGLWALSLPELKPIWIWCYNTPIIGWFNFTNTVVLGGVMLWILAMTPLVLGMYYGVYLYRRFLSDFLLRSGLVKWLKATRIAQWGYRVWRVL